MTLTYLAVFASSREFTAVVCTAGKSAPYNGRTRVGDLAPKPVEVGAQQVEGHLGGHELAIALIQSGVTSIADHMRS